MNPFENLPPQSGEELARQKKVLDYLDKLGIQYDYYRHPPAQSMEDCDAFDRALSISGTHCKNLFLCNRQKTVFYLLVVAGDKPFRTAEMSRQLGVSRLSFADAGHLLQYLGCAPGSSGPLGLVCDEGHVVNLLLDEDLRETETLLLHPNVNTSSVRMRTGDFFQVFLKACGHSPRFVHLSNAESM